MLRRSGFPTFVLSGASLKSGEFNLRLNASDEMPPSDSTAADELIAEHGGDARAAVISLLALVEALRRENDYLAGAVSRGFIRLALPRDP